MADCSLKEITKLLSSNRVNAIHAAVKIAQTFVVELRAASVVKHMALTQSDNAFAIAQGVVHLM
jgi:hypothetical protein